MKVQLVVAQGVHDGKQIPIAVNEFVIGRDPTCQLRPASPAISKRHCAILVRGSQVFVRDYGSTNGTFLNDVPVQGEVEAKDKDHLKVGPLEFRLAIQAAPAVAKPPSKPVPKVAPKPAAEDDFASLLLGGDGDASATPSGPVPDGSTIMQMAPLPPPEEEAAKSKAPAKPNPNTANTSQAAADILRNYQRRPRS